VLSSAAGRRCGPVPAQMWASPGVDAGQSRRVLVMHRASAELHERGVSSTVAAHSDMHVKGHSRWGACGTWCAPQQGGMLLCSCRHSVRHAICTVHRAATCRLCRKRILRLRSPIESKQRRTASCAHALWHICALHALETIARTLSHARSATRPHTLACARTHTHARTHSLARTRSHTHASMTERCARQSSDGQRLTVNGCALMRYVRLSRTCRRDSRILAGSC
jgi:hypothetical protein